MNFYSEDLHFKRLFQKYCDEDMFEWADRELQEFGALCGTEIDMRAVHTDREGQPRLIKYDRMGNDVSEVWVNEGYLKTVEQVYNKGIVGYVHKTIPKIGRKADYFYSYAQGYLLSQTEPGFYCPVTLTMATAYLLEQYADETVRDRFLPHVISTGETELYEGATFLTERQGGSDVGANETRAVAGDEAGVFYLTGEKYFASNAGMCGVAMVLARMEGARPGTKGLSLFAVPWRNEDGSLNGISIRRLKDKLGVRAVPSAEVEFSGAKAYLVGDPSKGIHYMMEALNLSRVCNAVASIGIMRRAYLEARKYAVDRSAFGKKLIEYPMIKESLTHLAVKQEVETSAIFRLIPLFSKVMDPSRGASDREKVMNRLLIAILKKESAEQSIHFAHEAIEMHGGNGFIEDFVTPRLLRDAQVLTVWEGTANILGLEVLRLMNRFHAHNIFIQEMETELAQLSARLTETAKPVLEGLESLKEMCSFMVQQSEDVQTLYAKKGAKLMADIFESVTVLSEAASGTERDFMKAELFLTQTWKSGHDVDTEMKVLKYFEVIVLEKQNKAVR
ncbi:acyl-CoA dehydrogenase family protein [Fictibacillus aquaticus]|uniref:Isovaleryl-CoA dehydrogenase n=1 Tax=Fictibacillus aquaticus TaxID=2021314 RepID=A0A235FDT5_9BACL|nr:acyl-CoA dehydrogenase family protein [Fictibacillus aquaticus]OYD59518.1 isovaleryl-CoA dehydrogenase [Fictibacillus aquaticus]